MEILQIKDLNLSLDEINSKYTEWVKFYNSVVFDVHFSEIINNYKYCIINNNKLFGLLHL
jgi:hypothetical protein